MTVKKKASRVSGAVLLVVSILAFIAYTYLLLGTGSGMLVLQLTVLGAVAVLLTVRGWIGYTMLTAPREEGTPSA